MIYLICTVGGSHEPILKAIRQIQPEHVCFVCSADDSATGNKGSHIQITGKGNVICAQPRDERPTLPNIPTQASLDDDAWEILEVSPDNLDDVYAKIMDWFSKCHPEKDTVTADYTGGTKTMSAGLVAAALDTGWVNIQLVTAPRTNLARVEGDEGEAIPATVENTRFQRNLSKTLEPWKRFAYEESVELLQALQPPREAALQGIRQRLLGLSRGFAEWDRFDHAGAAQRLRTFQGILGKSGQAALWAALTILDNNRPGSEPLRLYDLWRNAQRRAAQGRYDDAIARLYRLLEWSAQWLLHKRTDIETANVRADRIPESITITPDRDGRYKAGLYNAWELVAAHAGEDLRDFWNAQRGPVLDLLQKRNHSILAHGFEALGNQDWLAFANWTEAHLLPLLMGITTQQPWNIRDMPLQLPVDGRAFIELVP